MTTLLAFLSLCLLAIHAQQAPGLAGDWTGTLHAGGADLHLTLHIIRTDDGLYVGRMISVDQENSNIPVTRATVDGKSVKLTFAAVAGEFSGQLNDDASKLEGTWTQGAPLPLTFTRTGKPAPAAEPGPEAKPAPKFLALPLDVYMPIAPTPLPRRGRKDKSGLRAAHHQLQPGRAVPRANRGVGRFRLDRHL